MSLLDKIKQRGFVRSLEMAFNRFVPPWIFRYSTGDVFELDMRLLCEMSQEEQFNPEGNQGFQFKLVEDEKKRSDLRKATWNSVKLSSSRDDFGYSVSTVESDPRDPAIESSDLDRSNPLIGGVWAAKENFLESNLGFQIGLRDDQAIIYCAYVDKETRGLGIYQRLLSFTAQHLSEQGFRQMFVMVAPWIKASSHIHKKLSLRTAGRITAVRILFVSFVSTKGDLAKDKSMTTNLEFNPVKIDVF
jgi:ribosomal protein S18 acetylase RimI-like enzyme